MALWDATGGFLQLIPVPLDIGKPHDVVVRWQDDHLVVDVDGKRVMDYWDRTLPYTQGQVGLAVWKSTVGFEHFEVVEETGKPVLPPAHKPDFRLN